MNQLLLTSLGLLLALVSGKQSYKKKQELPIWKDVSIAKKVSLRGLSAIDEKTCWISGQNGTIMRTIDGGKNWIDCSTTNFDSVDFRDIQAFDDQSAFIVSAGLPATILHTTNGGESWNQVFYSNQEGLFFDAIDFFDSKNGIAFSDAIDSTLKILITNNAGKTWSFLPDSISPIVLPKQGGFAASGTCLKVIDSSSVIIGLGGKEATILKSDDKGLSWTKSISPLDKGSSSKGNYSFDFFNSQQGFVVGGDFYGDSASTNSIAFTQNGGKNWELITDTVVAGKYRSAVVTLNNQVVVTASRTGSNVSFDRGKSWFDLKEGYYALSKDNANTIWASGSKGKVGRLVFEP